MRNMSYNKIKMETDYEKVIKKIVSLGFEICNFEKKHLKALYDMPAFKTHTDPIHNNE